MMILVIKASYQYYYIILQVALSICCTQIIEEILYRNVQKQQKRPPSARMPRVGKPFLFAGSLSGFEPIRSW